MFSNSLRARELTFIRVLLWNGINTNEAGEWKTPVIIELKNFKPHLQETYVEVVGEENNYQGNTFLKCRGPDREKFYKINETFYKTAKETLSTFGIKILKGDGEGCFIVSREKTPLPVLSILYDLRIRLQNILEIKTVQSDMQISQTYKPQSHISTSFSIKDFSSLENYGSSKNESESSNSGQNLPTHSACR